jgi:hypothetical protein
VRDDGDALTVRHAQRVEARGLGAREPRDLGPRELAERLGRLVRLVDHRNPVAVDELGPLDEVEHCERYAHVVLQGAGRPDQAWWDVRILLDFVDDPDALDPASLARIEAYLAALLRRA